MPGQQLLSWRKPGPHVVTHDKDAEVCQFLSEVALATELDALASSFLALENEAAYSSAAR